MSGQDSLHRERSEVLLVDDLKQYLYNRYAKDGITPNEVESIVFLLRTISGTIYEANKAVYKLISDGFIFNREDRTQKDLYIELIDFDTPENNIFKVVNQFEIEGVEKQLRIPDGIVFINGIPVAVLEFKSAVKENTTIMDAYTQLTVRYRRDIPELFKYNAFVVISDGANNKYGSFFSPYDFFYAWRKIEADDKEMDGINSLTTMVKGLFRKERLLAVIKDFIYFPDNSDKDLKIVCRYPQFFAANKLFENIKQHIRPEGDGKGGTYFGATGCGKSYTMMFLTRMLMKSKFFHSPTILIITDRTDLDDQLSKQFVGSKKYIGDDTIVSIESREKLRQELSGRTSGGVYLTTIQKFTEDLQLLTDRANVICISDEAHRSQINLDQKVKITAEGVNRTYGFAKYLHDSLPNATYVGFTGTPIDATIEVFGGVVDAYTMTEAVRDGITVMINNGERPKYYVENNHPAIIDSSTFGRVQEEMARRCGKRKVKQVGTKTEQGRYSSKYALTELLICGECGTPYRRCTWAANGKKKVVWRCINRLDYGKKYCHDSPSIEESVLQEAVMNAVLQTAKQNVEVLKTLKLHIGMGLSAETTEDNSLDLQIRIAEIEAEFQKMLKAIAADNVEAFDEEKAKALMDEKAKLQIQLDRIADTKQKRENAKSRLDEIFVILEALANHPISYDDQIVRQILESVIVESKDRIKVVFIGGLEVTQLL